MENMEKKAQEKRKERIFQKICLIGVALMMLLVIVAKATAAQPQNLVYDPQVEATSLTWKLSQENSTLTSDIIAFEADLAFELGNNWGRFDWNKPGTTAIYSFVTQPAQYSHYINGVGQYYIVAGSCTQEQVIAAVVNYAHEHHSADIYYLDDHGQVYSIEGASSQTLPPNGIRFEVFAANI